MIALYKKKEHTVSFLSFFEITFSVLMKKQTEAKMTSGGMRTDLTTSDSCSNLKHATSVLGSK